MERCCLFSGRIPCCHADDCHHDQLVEVEDVEDSELIEEDDEEDLEVDDEEIAEAICHKF